MTLVADITAELDCAQCHKPIKFTVDADAFAAWAEGKTTGFVQDVFPNLTASEREMLITQTCGECWDKMFPEEPEPPAGQRVEWSNLPGYVKAAAMNDLEKFRGARWYHQHGAYDAYRGDPGKMVGFVDERRV